MNENYDSHCYIQFMGKMWYIIRVSPGRLHVATLNGVDFVGCIIDISEVDWDGYCKEAVELLEKEYGHVGENDHQVDQRSTGRQRHWPSYDALPDHEQ